ncbi:hypothetical protein N7481_005320 [Penicillium waksmanii]|uniref:uncharacterized protein n=1 Tax=Penicillium waksmanii TaxID=69791 RepID=UPI0025469018|nr:uncharacterized protein N7481_005320 [Penicillium waksmanii]KAJ5983221.1 hypothetical protein N7481_005320 [Penicillium waksmanii]
MATTIRPGQFPDFHAVGRRTGTEADLAVQEFLTHCPPDLPPRHRIVALLGTTDDKGEASPAKDGWFVSDFYLFHHLLSPETPQLEPNQIWLTSEDPESLVTKYKEYLHGDSQGDRRVVLDRAMLRTIVDGGRVRVVPRDMLLERFMNSVREQVAEARSREEHLLLLIFGHGTPAYGVEVANAILQIADLRRVLRDTPDVTIFTTSCYSGGWLVFPDPRGKHLNTTAIAAAGPSDLSSSWPQSGSIGRASGSLAASGILRCLIDTETEERLAADNAQMVEDIVSGDGITDTMKHPTYIQLAKSIHDSVKSMGLLGSTQQIYFSAENDEWETSYRPRLGLPLVSYEAKWNALRKVNPSPSSVNAPTASRSGGRPLKRLKYLAQEYLESKPGADNLAPNLSLHGSLKRVLRGAMLPKEEVEELTEMTGYRLGSMYEADYLRKVVGLQYPSIFDIDASSVIAALPTARAIEQHETWMLLIKLDINTTPIGIRRPYDKPLHYLTLALTETLSSWESIEAHIREMAMKKRAWFRFIYQAWQGHRVSHDQNVRMSRRAFLEAFKSMKIGQ